MGSLSRTSLALFGVLILHVAGLFLFASGFFLTRLELPDRSACADPPFALTAERCWSTHRSPFKRAIILVVDALRYDFAALEPVAGGPHWRGHLPSIRDAARLHPERARLLRFRADAPTTT